MFIASVLFLAAGAVIASGSLFYHQRLTTFLATAGIFWEASWLLLSGADRLLAPWFTSKIIFWWGSLLLFLLSLLIIRHWRVPYWFGSSRAYRDLFVLAVLAPVLLATWFIVTNNGFFGGVWRSHSFYNGDTATFTALTQRSLLTPGLLTQNPFAGNGPLEYPTLLHGGVASFMQRSGLATGGSWLYFLPTLTYLFAGLTVPLFFLVFDTIFPAPLDTWRRWFGISGRWVVDALAAGTILYVLALSWDTYIYPQSHFFLTALFLLLIALFVRSLAPRGTGQLPWLLPASAITFVLLFSNAILGTAAVTLLLVFSLLRVADRKRPLPERTCFVLGITATLFVFFFFPPGNGSLGWPHFSYTAAADILRLAPAMVFVVIALLRGLKRQPFAAIAGSSLLTLGFLSFFFSQRAIVVDNASRFLYHSLFIAFPLFVALIIQLFFWLKHQLFYTTLSWLEQAGALVLLGSSLILVTIPAVASVVSAHDHLQYKDQQEIGPALSQALVWIEKNTPPSAVFIMSPAAPLVVPAFTGRAVLRTDYWLSPDDELFGQIKAAFSGNAVAQERVVRQAHYLLLRPEDQPAWKPLTFPPVFENEAVAIYQLQ